LLVCGQDQYLTLKNTQLDCSLKRAWTVKSFNRTRN